MKHPIKMWGLGALSLALVAACSQSPEIEEPLATTPDSTPAASVDYKALLTRTDAVEICVDQTGPALLEAYGSDFALEGWTEATCACLSDGVRVAMEQVRPDQPILQNAIVQVSSNSDVIKVIFGEDKNSKPFGSFMRYLDEYGPDELGFDFQQFQTALLDGSEIASSKSLEEILATVPSCADAMSIIRSKYPEVDHQADPYFASRAYAIQRFDMDPGIELETLRRILRSNKPMTTCKEVLTQFDGRPIPEGQRETFCRVYFCGINKIVDDYSDAYRLRAKQLNLAITYVQYNKTTSIEEDLIHLILDPSAEPAWTPEQLHWVVTPFVEQFDRNPWNSFDHLLNEISDPIAAPPIEDIDDPIELASVAGTCGIPSRL